MGEEKKSLSRRSFLRGATTAGVVAAVSGGGLFIQPLEGQTKKFIRGGVKEPPGVKEDKDFKPLAQNLGEASVQGAYDAFNAATEDFVKGKHRKMNTKALLAKQGLKLRSSEAKATSRSFNTPASVMKVRQLQLKQKGWHVHSSFSLWGIYWHSHVSW